MGASKTNKAMFIPGLFTALNIFCGFLAVIKISEDRPILACWLIIFAGVFDVLDGLMARLTKTSSEIGIEFDSLADVVSFGVAPSILLYHVYFYNLGSFLGAIISFSPLVFGAFRLARFNVQTTVGRKTNFSGLPIPFAAISLASFFIFNDSLFSHDLLYLKRLLGPHIAVICLLMVSTIEYNAMPKFTFKAGRTHSIGVIAVILAFLSASLFPHETLYPIAIIYILWGVIRAGYKMMKTKRLSRAGRKVKSV